MITSLIIIINKHPLQVETNIKSAESEQKERIHGMSVAYWPSFALKLGLEMGLADESNLNNERVRHEIPPASFQALIASWMCAFLIYYFCLLLLII